MRRCVADTGPLVALLNRRDPYHDWAKSTLASAAAPILTCEAVLAETAHLVRHLPGCPAAVVELVERGVLAVAFRLADDPAPVRSLLAKYADVPMSLADACLVRMAERDAGLHIVTLDSDFRVYRRLGRLRLAVLTPDEG